MKKLMSMIIVLSCVFTITSTSFAKDKYGVGLMYSTEEVFTVIVDGYKGFYLGAFWKNMDAMMNTNETLNQTGIVYTGHDNAMNTTGLIYTGEEESMLGIDIGYAISPFEIIGVDDMDFLRFGLEGTVGYQETYYNYRGLTEDYKNRVKVDDDVVFGCGIMVGISPLENFEIVGSINTLKGMSIGGMIRF
jgi:hypothetical protein